MRESSDRSLGSARCRWACHWRAVASLSRRWTQIVILPTEMDRQVFALWTRIGQVRRSVWPPLRRPRPELFGTSAPLTSSGRSSIADMQSSCRYKVYEIYYIWSIAPNEFPINEKSQPPLEADSPHQSSSRTLQRWNALTEAKPKACAEKIRYIDRYTCTSQLDGHRSEV